MLKKIKFNVGMGGGAVFSLEASHQEMPAVNSSLLKKTAGNKHIGLAGAVATERCSVNNPPKLEVQRSLREVASFYFSFLPLTNGTMLCHNLAG